jgi:hypothetical protein
MSMEILVLSDRTLDTLEHWQQCISAHGVPLELPVETAIHDLKGFLPVRSEGQATGFECDHSPANEVMEIYGDVDFGRLWKHALAFNWHGPDEGLAAYQAAAAYAEATHGIVFDPQDGVVMDPRRAFGVAEKMKADFSKIKDLLRIRPNTPR